MLRDYRNLYHYAETLALFWVIMHIATLIILTKVLNISLKIYRLQYFIEDTMIIINVNNW
ncbi:hypothetical protein CRI66_07200 [Escherichia sp. E4694]|nr:hypothetical protein CRI66_07200 [Escherichia sp. E4694]